MIRKIGYVEIDNDKFWLWTNIFEGKKGTYAVIFFNIVNHKIIPFDFIDFMYQKKQILFKYRDKTVRYMKLLGGRPCIMTKVYACDLLENMEKIFLKLKKLRKTGKYKFFINKRYKNLTELVIISTLSKI